MPYCVLKMNSKVEFINKFNALTKAEKKVFSHAKKAVISACIGRDREGLYEAIKNHSASEYFKKKVNALKPKEYLIPDHLFEVVKMEIINASEEEAREYW